MDKLTRTILRVHDLPTLPRNVLRVTELINNPLSSAKDIARIIQEDQVLTARVLRLVNSAFYGFPQRISTVTAAVVLLGFDAIRHLLLTSSVFELFHQKGKAPLREGEQLWDHSVGCAVAAKVLGTHLRYEKIEELFVAGLLHDIGKIVEMLFLPDEFALLLALVKERDVLMLDAEREILGFTHADMGKALAVQWNLPPKLTEVIAGHHEMIGPREFQLEAAVVHLADILARVLQFGSGGDRRVPPIAPEAWKTLGLEIQDLEGLMEATERAFLETGELFQKNL